MDRLTALQVFIAVVEQGSLSAGAERLDMSRAMVTRYLAELERWMGARLLHRTTRRQSLTTAGEEALRYARQMVALSDSLEQVSQHANSAPRGQLRVTCSYSLAQHFLIPAVSAYQAQWPEVSVDILLQDKAVNLVEERIDVALRITAELDPNLVARRLGVCRSVVCASPDYLRRQGTPLSPPALTQHNCLTYTYFGKSVWEFSGVDGPCSVAV
ncbi:MAG: LysR family transcriptional regulator, partial [Plesiomonas shigelloides]